MQGPVGGGYKLWHATKTREQKLKVQEVHHSVKNFVMATENNCGVYFPQVPPQLAE